MIGKRVIGGVMIGLALMVAGLTGGEVALIAKSIAHTVSDDVATEREDHDPAVIHGVRVRGS